MNYWISVIFSFSIIISVIISCFKLKRISTRYYPFVLAVWFNLLGCIASLVASLVWRNNAVTSNIYFIVFCLLIVWQFKNWGIFGDRTSMFYALVAALVAVWIFDNFLWGSLMEFNPIARVINSMVIVILSIRLLSSELTVAVESFWKSSIRLILCTYVILFTVKIITEFFWQYGIQLGDDFKINIYFLYGCINFLANLMYALAMLWIPVTTRYSWLPR